MAIADTSPGLVLHDNLGRSWRNEMVTFSPSPADLAQAKRGSTLLDPHDAEVAYQLVNDDKGKPLVAFCADLDAFETRNYHFVAKPGHAATDLVIAEQGDEIRLSNTAAGIALRTKLTGDAGPVSALRLHSGQWVGGSKLLGTTAFKSYSAKVTARGPVYAEVQCRAESTDGHLWQAQFRLFANAPVVTVEETSDLGGEAAWTLQTGAGFTPDHLLYRMGRSSANGSLGTVKQWTIAADAEPAFVLEPWLHWWERDRQGDWCSLYSEAGPDLLSFAAYDAGTWVAKGGVWKPASELTVESGADGVQLHLNLGQAQRHWMISVLNKAPSLELLQGKDVHVAPPAQQLLIKYGNFPLDRVKDEMNYAGSTATISHPRLYITKAQSTAYAKTFVADPATLATYRKADINFTNIEGAISYFLGTGDPALGAHLCDAAVAAMQSAVDMLVKQEYPPSLGVAPHGQTEIFLAVNLADAVLDSGTLSPQLRARLQCQIAFLGYTINRDDYWSPERGFSANPNMTSTVAAYQTVLGAMIPNHPLSAAWMKRGLTELKRELYDWSDSNGGWLEAPAYALVSYDYMIGGFLVAKNAGMADYSLDQRMKLVAQWFAQISTPPDVDILGHRHLPPIGNTYFHQITGEFGLVAGIWKEADPQFAAQMQWMYQQQGSDPIIAVGGRHPTMAGYRRLLVDETIKAAAPAYQSALFPRTGAVLRAHFPSNRETYLHIIAGDNHAHYDKDSGSIVVWGKGSRIADDFGYEGYMPGEDHNMVVSPVAHDDAIFHIDSFATAPELDMVHGSKDGWSRSVMLVKSGDPMGPNYFVLNDSLAIPAPATWRLWLASDDVRLRPQGALAVGQGDIDTEIYMSRPAAVPLAKEVKVRESYGLKNDGSYGKMKWSLTGLISDLPAANDVTTVLYPRLKTEAAPVFGSQADGKVLTVQTAAGTDTIFLSDKAFKYEHEGISFEGTCGLLRVRGGVPTLVLGAPGRLSALGKSVQKAADKPAAATGTEVNVVKNGDLETGESTLFAQRPANDNLALTLHQGNPAAPAEHAGNYSVEFRLKTEGRGNAAVVQPLFVDSRRVYRVSVKIYTADAIAVAITGYGSDGKNVNLPDERGRVWGYSADLKGPTTGWQTLSTTIGPAGSGAALTWPKNILKLGITMRLTGVAGTVYADDFSLTPVPATP